MLEVVKATYNLTTTTTIRKIYTGYYRMEQDAGYKMQDMP